MAVPAMLPGLRGAKGRSPGRRARWFLGGGGCSRGALDHDPNGGLVDFRQGESGDDARDSWSGEFRSRSDRAPMKDGASGARHRAALAVGVAVAVGEVV
jgi:hypothetical protein